MALPRFLMLKSNANKKYLCHTKEKLGFTYDKLNKSEQDNNITHSHLRFEVENSKTVDGLVHIRSCYNNKYLLRKCIDSNDMAAAGHESEEDQSKWNCTMFKPILVESAGEVEDEDFPTCNIRLLHVSESEERCVGIHMETGHLIASVGDHSSFILTAIDVEASTIIPQYFTLMGSNDKYLTIDGSSPVFQLSATDIGASGVAQKLPEVAGTSLISTQQTHIIHKESNKYWCMFPMPMPGITGLLFLSDNTSVAVYFEPMKVDSNYTAFRCKYNNMFLSSFQGSEDLLLLAHDKNITQGAMLRVGEPVRSRSITDATYDLDDSRTYGNNSVEKFSDSRSNYSEVEQEGSFKVKYTTEQSSTWRNSTTVNIGIKVSWSAGIPFVGEMGVDISYDHNQTWESGGEIKTSKDVTYTQGIKIPPMKKVTLKVLAQKASCDVPYTCNATDLMTDGTTREYAMSGLYTGTNEFLFDTKITQDDL